MRQPLNHRASVPEKESMSVLKKEEEKTMPERKLVQTYFLD